MGNKSHFFRRSSGGGVLSLVAEYNFNNNLIDEIGGNNGTGTDITYDVGSFGNEAVFNGSTSEVRTPNSTVWDISNGVNDTHIRIEVLVKFNSVSGQQFILAKSPKNGFGWEVISVNSKIYITIYDSVNFAQQLQIGCDIQTDENGYSNILVDYDGQGLSSGLDVSVNGISSGIVDGTTNYTSAYLLNTDTTFGRADRRYDRRLDGAISQIKIYK